MATNIVQCDNCQQVVKQKDAHGWLEIRTWVTKPTPEQYAMMAQDPRWQQEFTAAQLTEGAPMPPLIGGDFCTIDCLLTFCEGNRALLTMETTTDVQPKSVFADGWTPSGGDDYGEQTEAALDLPTPGPDEEVSSPVETAEEYVNRINEVLRGEILDPRMGEESDDGQE